jgi:hypothetical protein
VEVDTDADAGEDADVGGGVPAQELPLLLPALAPAPLILPPLLSPATVGPVSVRAGAGVDPDAGI